MTMIILLLELMLLNASKVIFSLGFFSGFKFHSDVHFKLCRNHNQK